MCCTCRQILLTYAKTIRRKLAAVHVHILNAPHTSLTVTQGAYMSASTHRTRRRGSPTVARLRDECNFQEQHLQFHSLVFTLPTQSNANRIGRASRGKPIRCVLWSVNCTHRGAAHTVHPRMGEAKFTAIHVALRHFIKEQTASSALHDCCTLTSTTDFGKAHSQLFYGSSQGIQ